MRTVLFHPWFLASWAIIIRPHFFEESLNGEVYTDFLENILLQLLENIPLDLRINMWMQHDGRSAHSVRISRLKMQEIFLQKLIGREIQ